MLPLPPTPHLVQADPIKKISFTYRVQWAAKVLRAALEKWLFSYLNMSGLRQDISVLLTALNAACSLVLLTKYLAN
jgi:hypothetical protein